MMDHKYRLTSGAVIGFLAILILVAHCAGPQVVAERERAQVKDRIHEYWQYKIKGDVEKAYQCELPAFRENVSILQYVNRFRLIKYTGAEIQEIDVKGKEATSTSKVAYIIFLNGITGKKLNRVENERWEKIK